MTTETAEATETTETTTEAQPSDGSLLGGGQEVAADTSESSEASSSTEVSGSWTDAIQSDELKGSKSLGKFKSLDDLISSYLSAEKEVSSRLKVPDKDDDAGLDDIYGKLGRPENAEGYDFSEVEGSDLLAGEAAQANLGAFRDIAHKERLTKRQAAALVNWNMEQVRAQAAQLAEQSEANVAELRKEYGASFDERTKLANDTLKMLVDKSNGDWNRVSQAMASSPLGSQPDLVKALSQMGRMMQQDRIYNSGGEVRSMGGESVPELRSRIEKLKQDNMRDLTTGSPAGREVQKEINALLDRMGKAS